MNIERETYPIREDFRDNWNTFPIENVVAHRNTVSNEEIKDAHYTTLPTGDLKQLKDNGATVFLKQNNGDVLEEKKSPNGSKHQSFKENHSPSDNSKSFNSGMSSFEIDSVSESPGFSNSIRYISPHEPPLHEPESNFQIKQQIISNRSYYDRFNHLMEDRMLRWNTSTSQYNIEPVLSNTHPFQTRPCELSSTSMFNVVKNWFVSENQPINEIKVQPLTLLSSVVQISPDLEKFQNLNLKPNSSKSFINTINSQPKSNPDMVYTPIINPIYDFNFNKTSKSDPTPDFSQIDIVNQNFLNSCLNGCWPIE